MSLITAIAVPLLKRIGLGSHTSSVLLLPLLITLQS